MPGYIGGTSVDLGADTPSSVIRAIPTFDLHRLAGSPIEPAAWPVTGQFFCSSAVTSVASRVVPLSVAGLGAIFVLKSGVSASGVVNVTAANIPEAPANAEICPGRIGLQRCEVAGSRCGWMNSTLPGKVWPGNASRRRPRALLADMDRRADARRLALGPTRCGGQQRISNIAYHHSTSILRLRRPFFTRSHWPLMGRQDRELEVVVAFDDDLSSCSLIPSVAGFSVAGLDHPHADRPGPSG